MNLICGKLLDDAAAKKELGRLEEMVLAARSERPPTAEEVIAACDALSKSAKEEEFVPLLIAGGMPAERAAEEFRGARELLTRSALEQRLKTELGGISEGAFTPIGSPRPVRHSIRPLGTLFHISAGNVDALPVFSVLEGLLTGNVNILKLPSGEGGLSVLLLQKLFEAEPKLASRVIVFDMPSADTAAMERMAACADAIVVWGGDEAVRAVRKLARPDTRLIEWGHKVSFAYVSGECGDGELFALCRNICETEQLLCSSCQGVFLDTESEEDTERFALRFADALEAVSAKIPVNGGLAARARATLELYTEALEGRGQRNIMRRGCAVSYGGEELAVSHYYRTPWVRALPKGEIVRRLAPYKGRLQTAALICPEAEREELKELLFAAGVTRLASPERMSKTYPGMPHDGRPTLAEYVKIVSAEE